MVLLRTKLYYPIFEFWEGEIMAIRLVTWYNIQKIIQFWLHLFAFHAKIHVIHFYIRDVSVVTEIKQFGHFWIGFSYSKVKQVIVWVKLLTDRFAYMGTFFCLQGVKWYYPKVRISSNVSWEVYDFDMEFPATSREFPLPKQGCNSNQSRGTGYTAFILHPICRNVKELGISCQHLLHPRSWLACMLS